MANETAENGFRQASNTRSNAPYFKDQNAPMGFTYSIAAGATNQTLVSVSAIDGSPSQDAVLSSQIFNFWLSDSATGYSLSTILPSGGITATAGSILQNSLATQRMQKRLVTTSVTPVVVPGFALAFGEAASLHVTVTGNDLNTNVLGGKSFAAGYRASSGNVILINEDPIIYVAGSTPDYSVVADVASQSLAVEVVGISTTFIWAITFEQQKSVLSSSQIEVQTNSLGVLTLAISDLSKTPYYLCAQNPYTGQVFVSRQLTTADYGV